MFCGNYLVSIWSYWSKNCKHLYETMNRVSDCLPLLIMDVLSMFNTNWDEFVQ